MSEHTNLTEALAAVQGQMPSVAKSRTANTGSYSYSYADIADVSAAILPLLSNHGLAFTCEPNLDSEGRTLINGSLRHVSGEIVTAALPLFGRTPQEIGSSITYARRYLLGCLTGIVTDDDEDGTVANQNAKPLRQRSGKASEKQVNLIRALITENGMDTEAAAAFIQTTTGRGAGPGDLTSKEASTIIEALNDVKGQA